MAISGPSIRAGRRATPTIPRWRNRKPPDRFIPPAKEGYRMRKGVLAGVGVATAALLGGAALYYFRERFTNEADFRPLETDGDHQIRDYPALTVAETVVAGTRKEALDQGYQIL